MIGSNLVKTIRGETMIEMDIQDHEARITNLEQDLAEFKCSLGKHEFSAKTGYCVHCHTIYPEVNRCDE
jgi:hypothetical protein